MSSQAPDSCPRCGCSPLEITKFGDQERSYARGCPCYPHPPVCISCHTPLDDGRCDSDTCPHPYIIQPDPITDPLYDPDEHGGAW